MEGAYYWSTHVAFSLPQMKWILKETEVNSHMSVYFLLAGRTAVGKWSNRLSIETVPVIHKTFSVVSCEECDCDAIILTAEDVTSIPQVHSCRCDDHLLDPQSAVPFTTRIIRWWSRFGLLSSTAHSPERSISLPPVLWAHLCWVEWRKAACRFFVGAIYW